MVEYVCADRPNDTMKRTGAAISLCCLFTTLAHGQVSTKTMDDRTAEYREAISEGYHSGSDRSPLFNPSSRSDSTATYAPYEVDDRLNEHLTTTDSDRPRFRVYSSPSNDHLFISAPLNDPIKKIRLFDHDDVLLSSGTQLIPGAAMIDLSTLHPGMYYVEITQAGAVRKQGFVKW